MPIVIDGVYDGANPQDPAAIERLGENHFLVRPFSEDGDGNYKFALNVRATNDGPSAQSLHLEVDWNDPEYMADRNFVHISVGNDWAFVPAEVSGTRSIVRRDLAPGVSYIGLSPAYGLGDHDAFCAGLPQFGYERKVAGQSEQGRDIETFQLGRGPKQVLITARFHPYETASSYCLEGLMDWLGQPFREQEALLQQFCFTIVPMPNPDGVYLGLCKRTFMGGVDLPHEGALAQEAASRALLGLVDALRPAAWLDLHGWMYADQDGADYRDPGLGDRFLSAVGGPGEHRPGAGASVPESVREGFWSAFVGNRWKANLATGQPRPGSLHDYCGSRFNTAWLALSYRWPGRSVLQMRTLGAPTLQAFCTAL